MRAKRKWNPGQLLPQDRPRTDTALRAWSEKSGITLTTLAEALGMNRKTLENWIWGRCLPPLVWAFKIELYTKGEVPASSWLATDMGQAQWKMEGSDATRG